MAALDRAVGVISAASANVSGGLGWLIRNQRDRDQRQRNRCTGWANQARREHGAFLTMTRVSSDKTPSVAKLHHFASATRLRVAEARRYLLNLLIKPIGEDAVAIDECQGDAVEPAEHAVGNTHGYASNHNQSD